MHCRVAPRIELQVSGCTCLKYGKPHRNGGEQRRFPAAVFGEQEGGVFFE